MKPRNIFLATLKEKAGFPMEEEAVPILEKAGIPIVRNVQGYIYVKGEDEGRAIEALRQHGKRDDFSLTPEEKSYINAGAPIAAPAVDYDALKDETPSVLVHQGNATGPSGCLENQEALRLYSDEALVEELRVRGWTVSCTKSI